jgi:CheY-like chemotaxis protein
MSTKQVLIIDHEAAVLEVVQSCFEDVAGWHVVTATSSQDGLIKASNYQPDAIVLDLLMPDMSGVELLRCLKASPTTREIPVVLLTIAVDFFDSSYLSALQPAGIIAKPFDPTTLVQEVAALLNWTLETQE